MGKSTQAVATRRIWYYDQKQGWKALVWEIIKICILSNEFGTLFYTSYHGAYGLNYTESCKGLAWE